MKKWLFLIVALPIVEIILLVYAGQRIGFWWTLSLLIATGILGFLLVQSQGVRTWQIVQEKMRRGEPPGYALLNGFILLIAGILLMFPGFLTDLLGVLALFPFVRKRLSQYIIKRLYDKMKKGKVVIFKQK